MRIMLKVISREMTKFVLIQALPFVAVFVMNLNDVLAQELLPKAESKSVDLTKDKMLYCVGYAHLDTQWRWAYPQVIREFIANTLHDNFKLIDKYPNYLFNFTGSRRYEMMKEYYPEDYEKVKGYIAAGRWFPAGSSVDENDVNMPGLESIIRHVLYGNHFFRREFGISSNEYMLPDCFGFPASLPTILSHCGIKGFSTQKLTWGSAVGIPFKVGNWVGPDGNSIIAALDPGSYGSKIKEDLSQSQIWLKRVDNTGAISGAYVDYHYYGTGDVGGSPTEDSVRWLEQSIRGKGPIRVVSSTAQQMFNEIKPEQRAKLPSYSGDLLLTNHSAGSLTSKAYMKRWNRKNELLADACERASVTAVWLGGAPYPAKKLYDAWDLVLGSQMHDMLPGTTIPAALRYSWNDEVLALNQFAAMTIDAVSAVASAMDTRVQGVPLVVYNPVSIERNDIVEATMVFPNKAPKAVRVLDPEGKEVPAQINSRNGNKVELVFVAHVPAVGFVTYDIRPVQGSKSSASTNTTNDMEPMSDKSTDTASLLKVSRETLENARYQVKLNQNGDVTSIFDKASSREILKAPLRLAFLYEKPKQWPAWNMDFDDRQRPPAAYVEGPAKVRVVESGPVRVALGIERESQGSHFVQQIRLSAGTTGDVIEFVNRIDWQTPESSLEAVFPLQVSNPLAAYEDKVGVINRGNNELKKFEVPQQQWFDLTDKDGQYGVAVLNDSKFGSDKPDDSTMRLTLLYTPGVRNAYQDQGTQDFGHHDMVYAIAGHTGDWKTGDVVWKAKRLNQPLMGFQAVRHAGALSRQFSLFHLNSNQVQIAAIKKAEDNNEIIVRLKELDGNPVHNLRLVAGVPIAAVREVDGQEQEIGQATVQDGQLITDIGSFGLRAFALRLNRPPVRLSYPQSRPVDLPYDLEAISYRTDRVDGGFDKEGRAYPAEQLPATIQSEGIEFRTGPKGDGKKNALICRGQTINLPTGDFDHIYLLAAALNGDTKGTFTIGTHAVEQTVRDWSGFIGQWDDRLWKGQIPEIAYRWNNELNGLVPGFIKRDTVAWFASHRNFPHGGNDFYQYCYLFKYGFNLPAGVKRFTLPNNDNIRIVAVTVAKSGRKDVVAAKPLYDIMENHHYLNRPKIVPAGGQFSDAVNLRLDPPLYWQGSGLHYTLDGSEPTDSSPVYSKPIRLDASTTIKVRMIFPDGNSGPLASAHFEINDKTPPIVKSVSSLASFPAAVVTFSKSVQRETAEEISNYQFDPKVMVKSATLAEDGATVNLALVEPLPLNSLQLTVNGVEDTSPSANRVLPQPISITVARPVYSLDSVSCDGRTTKRQIIPGLPVGVRDSWTLNMFVRVDKQPEDDTLIAGFGRAENQTGWGRYLLKSDTGIDFWSAHENIETSAPLDIGKWQMLTVTYDGQILIVYKNAEKIGEGAVELSEDEPILNVAPTDPWDGKQRFMGEIRNLTIWSAALPQQNLKELLEKRP